jgi:hypothetical protein
MKKTSRRGVISLLKKLQEMIKTLQNCSTPKALEEVRQELELSSQKVADWVDKVIDHLVVSE